jgi:putative endopeptidase
MRNFPKYLLLAFLAIAALSFIPPKKKARKFIDRNNMDLSVKPGDNFYEYVNGNWIKNNPVPASKTRWGSFDELREQSSERIRSILEEAVAKNTLDRLHQMIGDFYSSGMDSIGLEKTGIDPLKSDLQRIDGINNMEGILEEIAYDRTHGLGGALFGFFIGQDDKNVNQYIPELSQGGTSLPDRDYYIKNDKRSTTIRAAYV